MSSEGLNYTKLDKDIVFSSLWAESPEVCKVWVTLLALKNRDQMVTQNITGIARISNLSERAVEEAIRKFEGRDDKSTSKKEDGRRLVPREGGWYVVNGVEYEQMGWSEGKREYERKRKAAYREKSSKSRGLTGGNVPDNVPRRTGVDAGGKEFVDEAGATNEAQSNGTHIPTREQVLKWASGTRALGREPQGGYTDVETLDAALYLNAGGWTQKRGGQLFPCSDWRSLLERTIQQNRKHNDGVKGSSAAPAQGEPGHYASKWINPPPLPLDDYGHDIIPEGWVRCSLEYLLSLGQLQKRLATKNDMHRTSYWTDTEEENGNVIGVWVGSADAEICWVDPRYQPKPAEGHAQ